MKFNAQESFDPSPTDATEMGGVNPIQETNILTKQQKIEAIRPNQAFKELPIHNVDFRSPEAIESDKKALEGILNSDETRQTIIDRLTQFLCEKNNTGFDCGKTECVNRQMTIKSYYKDNYNFYYSFDMRNPIDYNVDAQANLETHIDNIKREIQSAIEMCQLRHKLEQKLQSTDPDINPLADTFAEKNYEVERVDYTDGQFYVFIKGENGRKLPLITFSSRVNPTVTSAMNMIEVELQIDDN